jgi:uncharacterized protein YndB with AHSA1/START domain
MATVELPFDVPPERAFAVLSAPRTYGFWVVGSRAIHDADPRWPAPGATFHHSQGRWPFVIHDTTSVIACDPPRRLELEARVRPLLVSRVVFALEPDGAGTLVRMEEQPTGGLLELPTRLPPSPRLLEARNLETLRRLRWLAESEAFDIEHAVPCRA